MLGLVVAVGGGMLRDRVTNSAAAGETTVRLTVLERQVKTLEEDRQHFISREEFTQFTTAVRGSLDAVRQDLSDIKRDLRR